MKLGTVAAALLAPALTVAQGTQAQGQQQAQQQQAQQQTQQIQQERRQIAQEQAGGTQGSSEAFEQACHDLLRGRTPRGEAATNSLRKACDGLMSARAEEANRARELELQAREQRLQSSGTGSGGEVQAGRGTAQPQQGTGVLAAFEQAGRELTGQAPGLRRPGAVRSGDVRYSLVTNTIGWFTGMGVNAELSSPLGLLSEKFSWVAGAQYATADATSGSIQSFGFMGGADFFAIGQNNEGLRIGPRLSLEFGREDVGTGATTFGRLGLSGEAGYNFIASNGITLQAAVGVGGRVAGDENDDFTSFTGGEFGPYAKLGLGYSW